MKGYKQSQVSSQQTYEDGKNGNAQILYSQHDSTHCRNDKKSKHRDNPACPYCKNYGKPNGDIKKEIPQAELIIFPECKNFCRVIITFKAFSKAIKFFVKNKFAW